MKTFDGIRKQIDTIGSPPPGFEIISRYTRKEAIEDGVLYDITELAKEAGHRFPVAISTGVHVLATEAQEKGGRDYKGVIWDIISVLTFAIKASKKGGNVIYFTVKIWSKYTGKDQDVKLYCVCGEGDNMEPVLTIMLISED